MDYDMDYETPLPDWDDLTKEEAVHIVLDGVLSDVSYLYNRMLRELKRTGADSSVLGIVTKHMSGILACFDEEE